MCLAQGRVSNNFSSIHLDCDTHVRSDHPIALVGSGLQNQLKTELQISEAHTHYTLFLKKMHSEPHLYSIIVASLAFGKANL